MKWRAFNVENMDGVKFFGITLAMLFGHTPTGDAVLTFIIAHNKWARFMQIKG